MEGPITEGSYRHPELNALVKVEEFHYPRRRFVFRELVIEESGTRFKNNDLAEVTPQVWALLQDWL